MNTEQSKRRFFTQQRLNEIMLFFVLFACYVYVFPRWADWNQNSRFYLVQAVVEHGTITIDCCRENTGDYAHFEGHAYTDKAPGLSFAAIPIYAGYKLVAAIGPVDEFLLRVAQSEALASTLNPDGSGINMSKLHVAIGIILSTVLLVSLPAALLGVVLYRFLGEFTDHASYRLLVTLVYCLATIAWPYGSAFYAHQLTAALLFIPFALAFWFNPETVGRWRLFGFGFMLGYAVIAEYPVALIAGPIFLYAAYRLWGVVEGAKAWAQGLGFITLGGLLPGLAAAAYNFTIFHTPLPVAYYYSAEWKDIHGLTSFQPEAFWGITLSSYRGLFFYSPVLLLGLIGLIYLWQHRRYWPEALLSTLVVVILFYFNSSMKTWAGGFTVGPRYLVPMVPFLAWPLIFFLERHGQVLWGRAVFGGLALLSWLSIWAITLGGQQFPQDLPRADWNFPLRDYTLPLLLEGNIARNVGIILGFKGWASLLPLLMIIVMLGGTWAVLNRFAGPPQSNQQNLEVT